MPREMSTQQPHYMPEDEGGGDNQSFIKYKNKVFQLCRLLWPGYSAKTILIESLKRGYSRQIVSVRVTHMESRLGLDPGEKLNLPPGHYVLLVPWSNKDFKHVKAIHDFVGSRISFSVPTVVHFDTSSDNPLGSPYILQHHIPGERLDKIWPSLKYTQRLTITLEMARIYAQLMKVTNTSGGIPDMDQRPAVDGTLRTRDYRFPREPQSWKKTLEPQPPVDMLYTRLIRWWGWDTAIADRSPYYGAAEIVRHMQSTNRTFGAEDERPLYYLNHGSLCPRNIMVEARGENTAFVSGILDWDDAYFAPAVISFSPPAWLWMPESRDKSNYFAASGFLESSRDEPADSPSRELKQLFDSVVGPQFLRHAYSPDACLARKIWTVAYEVDGNPSVRREVEKIYEEWNATRGRTIKAGKK